VKVEPPEGEAMRRSGPFRGDVPSPEKSLHFWHNNFGKRSIVVDLDKPNGQEAFVQLASATEAVLSLRERGLFHHRGSDRFRTLDSLKLNSRAACGTVGGQQVVIFCKMTECAHSGFCNGVLASTSTFACDIGPQTKLDPKDRTVLISLGKAINAQELV
jgi:hypothetical protein